MSNRSFPVGKSILKPGSKYFSVMLQTGQCLLLLRFLSIGLPIHYALLIKWPHAPITIKWFQVYMIKTQCLFCIRFTGGNSKLLELLNFDFADIIDIQKVIRICTRSVLLHWYFAFLWIPLAVWENVGLPFWQQNNHKWYQQHKIFAETKQNLRSQENSLQMMECYVFVC